MSSLVTAPDREDHAVGVGHAHVAPTGFDRRGLGGWHARSSTATTRPGAAGPALEGRQPLEVVELAVEHVGLGRVARDVHLKCLGQLLRGLEAGDQAARLD